MNFQILFSEKNKTNISQKTDLTFIQMKTMCMKCHILFSNLLEMSILLNKTIFHQKPGLKFHANCLDSLLF